MSDIAHSYLFPAGDRLNYWCIGYIEKIGGGHHRHYEFFIWMLRRLNYRAVWATLLTASYMGPVDTSDSYEPLRVRSSLRNEEFVGSQLSFQIVSIVRNLSNLVASFSRV